MSLINFSGAVPSASLPVGDRWLEEEFFRSCTAPNATAADMATQFSATCRQRPDDTDEPMSYNSVPSDLKPNRKQMLQDERETWDLVARLLKDVETDRAPMALPEVPCKYRQCVNPRDVVANLLNNDGLLRRLHIVVQWLEDVLSGEVRCMADKADWIATLQRESQNKTEGGVMDLDVQHRDCPLEERDIWAEQRFLQGVWELVRAGSLTEARDLCDEAHQPWRAALVQVDVRQLDPTQATSFQPCVEWYAAKDCYRRLARDSQPLDKHERALCAYAGGALQPMIAACASWKEQLWAHLVHVLTYKIDQALVKYYGVTQYQPRLDLEAPEPRSTETGALIDRVSEELMRHDRMPDQRVQREAQAYFATIQTQLISALDLFLEPTPERRNAQVLEKLLEASQTPSAADATPTRFACHLALVLDAVQQRYSAKCGAVDTATRAEVVDRYVDHLQAGGGQIKAVAYYTAQLPPEDGVRRYSQFLETLEEDRLRQEAMEAAEQFHLDWKALTVETVCRIRKERQQQLLPPVPEGRLSADEQKEVMLLRLMTLRPGARLHALVQCNASVRSFVGEGKLQAGLECVDAMPANTLDLCKSLIDDPSGEAGPFYKESLREFQCWGLYLNAMRNASLWHNHRDCVPREADHVSVVGAQAGQSLSREAAASLARVEQRRRQQKWDEQEKVKRQKALSQLQDVLTYPFGWLQDIEPLHSDALRDCTIKERAEQLPKLRRRCLPEVMQTLLGILQSTQQYDCMLELATVLADNAPTNGAEALLDSFSPDQLKGVLCALADGRAGYEQQSAMKA